MTGGRDVQTTVPTFIQQLPERAQKTLLIQSQNRSLKAGEWLFRRGESADYFFVVKTGRIALYLITPQLGEILSDEVDGGQVLGVSWLVSPYRFCHHARALEDSELLQIDAAMVRQRMEYDGDLSRGLYRQFRPVMARYLARRYRPAPCLYKV